MARPFSFPHPVLGNNDDLSGDFTIRVGVDLGESIRISVEFDLISEGLVQLVNDACASFGLRIECGKTYFRESVNTQEPNIEHCIPSSRVSGRVVVEPFVTANVQLDSYSPSGLHADYGDAWFEILPGQILAVGDPWSFEANHEYDPLKAPVGSLIRIAKGDHAGRFLADFTADKITVEVTEDEWRWYQSTKKEAAHVVSSLIGLPVLVEAIRRIQSPNEREELSEFLWVSRLDDILEAKGLNIDEVSPLDAAQDIFECPISRALLQLDTELHPDGDE